ncbi:MAG: hypothetical protein U0230_21060 [Polyangiales bacterium]
MSDFPTVHDEATETPMWVPVLGIGLLVLSMLGAIVRSTVDEVSNPTASPEVAPADVPSGPQTPEELQDVDPREAIRRFLAGEME